MSYEFKVTLAI